MSLRYTGAWMQDGAFNPLIAPTGVPTYYPLLLSFGSGYLGGLALGNTTNYSSPKQVGSLSDWSIISGGMRSGNAAIKTDGTLWAWGSGAQGQLGLGNTTNYSSPKQVGALTDWKYVSSGRFHKVAIKTDGTLWAWGRNSEGELGINSTVSRSSPVQVGALTDWLTVYCGGYATFATKTDGTLWSWGYAGGGLGHGNTNSYSSPKQVGALTDWLQVVSGGYTTIAAKTDGTLWSWGGNTYGQLGLGNTTSYSSPKQVGALTTWKSVACTNSGSVISSGAVKTNGTLWTWGFNGYGTLGFGNTTYYSSPKQVGALTDWVNLTGGGRHFLSVKANKTAWAWGYNASGQLGMSNTYNVSSPKQIGSLTNWLTLSGGYDATFATVY